MLWLSFRTPEKNSCKMLKIVWPGILCPGQGKNQGSFFPDFWSEPWCMWQQLVCSLFCWTAIFSGFNTVYFAITAIYLTDCLKTAISACFFAWCSAGVCWPSHPSNPTRSPQIGKMGIATWLNQSPKPKVMWPTNHPMRRRWKLWWQITIVMVLRPVCSVLSCQTML